MTEASPDPWGGVRQQPQLVEYFFSPVTSAVFFAPPLNLPKCPFFCIFQIFGDKFSMKTS